MNFFSHAPSRIILFSFLFVIGFSPFSNSYAQTDGLSITVRPGFDGLVKSDSWFPVLVTLANDGVAVEGTLEISIPNSNGTFWATEVSLPTQSRKQIQTTVFAPGTSVRTLQVVLKDQDGKILLNSSNYPLKLLDASESLIYAVVSPEPDTLELLEKVKAGRSDAAVAFMAMDEIPVDPIGLEPLDVLVFNDTDTNGLSAGQRETIQTWIQQGGQLVLTGGAGWQKTTAAFSDLLPVEISTTDSVDGLASFEAASGEPFRDAGPYAIARSSLKNGELAWRNDSLPILARRAEGAGNIWFLALDPQFAPLDDWDGSLILWDSVAQYVPRPLLWEGSFANTDSLYQAVSTIPAIQLPSVWLILGFMGLYILMVGPLNYIVLTRMERREMAWLTLPITILFFSGVALLIGLQFRGNRLIINQLSIVSGRIDSEQLRVESGVGIYSPRRDSFDIQFEPDTRLNFVDRFAFGGLSDERRIALGSENVLEEVLVAVGEITSITASSFRDASPISGQAILSADGTKFDLVVTNNSPETIFNISLLVGTKHVRINDIGSGETVNREIEIPSRVRESFASEVAGGPETYRTYPATPDTYQDSPLSNGFSTLVEGEAPGGYTSYQYYDDPEQSQRNSLLNSLYETYNSETVYTPAGKIVLIGWSNAPQLDISLSNDRFDLVASSLYFIEIPLEK
ncbi:MAG: hypothetical protein AB8G95_06525 [Anaerolineae bacterium]